MNVTSLDLTKAPPRSPYLRLAGLCLMPRTIDKIRALLPGGNIGDYNINGASSSLFEAIGITADQFIRVVSEATSDDDVVAWLEVNADLSHAADINHRTLNTDISQIPADIAQMFRALHPALAPEEFAKLIDALELDDRRSFPSTAVR